VHSCRILHDIVHVIVRNKVSVLTPKMDLSLILESMYKGADGPAICLDPGPYDLVLSYRFLSKDL
jgi:hypothetical protein